MNSKYTDLKKEWRAEMKRGTNMVFEKGEMCEQIAFSLKQMMKDRKWHKQKMWCSLGLGMKAHQAESYTRIEWNGLKGNVIEKEN